MKLNRNKQSWKRKGDLFNELYDLFFYKWLGKDAGPSNISISGSLLMSLRKYPWERYEPPYPPSYGLNSTTTVLLGE